MRKIIKLWEKTSRMFSKLLCTKMNIKSLSRLRNSHVWIQKIHKFLTLMVLPSKRSEILSRQQKSYFLTSTGGVLVNLSKELIASGRKGVATYYLMFLSIAMVNSYIVTEGRLLLSCYLVKSLIDSTKSKLLEIKKEKISTEFQTHSMTINQSLGPFLTEEVQSILKNPLLIQLGLTHQIPTEQTIKGK